jgi:hypothetical protein
MTQPSSSEPAVGRVSGVPGHADSFVHTTEDQETLRIDPPDPDSTRPMSLAELRELQGD